MLLADRMGFVDRDVDVQPVIAQQHVRERVAGAAKADELRRVGQPVVVRPSRTRQARRVARHVDATTSAHLAAGERHGLIEEFVGFRDHALAANGVVAAALLGAVVLGDDVRAVERVVEAAPARVRGVQRVARVVDGHDELRAGERRDLGIDVRGRHLERRPDGHEIADLA